MQRNDADKIQQRILIPSLVAFGDQCDQLVVKTAFVDAHKERLQVEFCHITVGGITFRLVEYLLL